MVKREIFAEAAYKNVWVGKEKISFSQSEQNTYENASKPMGNKPGPTHRLSVCLLLVNTIFRVILGVTPRSRNVVYLVYFHYYVFNTNENSLVTRKTVENLFDDMIKFLKST